MAHAFVYDSETSDDHVFVCSKCGTMIQFNKPGVGTPNADLSGPTPVAPENVEDYVTPCPGAE